MSCNDGCAPAAPAPSCSCSCSCEVCKPAACRIPTEAERLAETFAHGYIIVSTATGKYYVGDGITPGGVPLLSDAVSVTQSPPGTFSFVRNGAVEVSWTSSDNQNAGQVPYSDDTWFLTTAAPNVQAALDQLSEFLSTAFGEELVILNNPVIYLDAQNGNDAVTIEDQTDLTQANAFQTFDRLYSFMENTLIQGTVVLRLKGDFPTGLVLRPDLFKNASLVDVRPWVDGSVGSYTLAGGRTAPNTLEALRLSGGMVTNIYDCTLRIYDEADESLSRSAFGFVTVDNAEVTFRGVTNIVGFYQNATRVDARDMRLFFCSGGILSLSENVNFNVTAGTELLMLYAVSGSSRIFFAANLVVNYGTLPIALTSRVALAENGGTMVFNTNSTTGIGTQFLNAGNIVAPEGLRIDPLSIVSAFFWGSNVSGNTFSEDWNAWYTGVPQPRIELSQIGTLERIAGLAWPQPDPNVLVF